MLKIAATLDGSGATLSKPSMKNAASAHESIGNDRRFLRKHEIVESDGVDDTEDDEEEEERGWFASTKVMTTFALAHMRNDMDEMQKILREVRDPDTIKSLYTRIEPTLKSYFPNFNVEMGPERFQNMINSADDLSDELKGMLAAAYSKYYGTVYLQ